MMDSINVIIPYSSQHTPETLLDRAVQSIEGQTVPTRPIIVEDDEQQGPGWARNVGLSQADSRYVAFCDADDYWLETKLEKQLDTISSNSSSICITQTQTEKTEEYNVKPFQSTEEFAEDVLLGRSYSFTSSILVDTYNTKTRFNEKLYRREDHLFALQAATANGVSFVNEPLTMIHKHSKGLSNETEDIEKLVESAHRFYDQVIEKYPHLKTHKHKYWHKQYHNIGRKYYFRDNYSKSIEYLRKALSHRIHHRTIGALLVSYLGNWRNQP